MCEYVHVSVLDRVSVCHAQSIYIGQSFHYLGEEKQQEFPKEDWSCRSGGRTDGRQ